jgi:tRNA (adenine37-N6)-methyltransferase
MLNEITVRPIGHVHSQRSSAEDDAWDSVATSIELDADVVEPTATLGLETFSHIEVVYVFHLVDEATACLGARHPRGRHDWPLTGILAQRAKDRPNRIGVTTCRLDAVDGLTVRVTGLDAIDGTPVLDIKPAMSGFGPRGDMREPKWAKELMEGYW